MSKSVIKSFLFSLTLSLTGCSSFLYWPTNHVYVDVTKLPFKPTEERIPVNETESLHAWIFKTPVPSKGVFVQFHGNAQNMTSHFLFLYWVLYEGYDFVTFDYRGYGQSSFLKPNPESTVQDAQKVLEYVQKKFPQKTRIAVGQSLGGAVMLRALLNSPALAQPDFIVLDSTFASYKQAARSVLKQRWFLYPLIPFTSIAFSDTYAPYEDLDKLGSQPKFVIHGTEDTTIRYELGEDLYKRLPPQKEFWPVEGGQHTSAFSQNHAREFAQKLISAIESSTKPSTASPNNQKKTQ